MKNITNAYLVLSVANIRDMLAAAELEQRVRGETRASVTIVLEDIVIARDGRDVQITCASFMGAVDRHAAESVADLEDRAMRDAAMMRVPCMNHSDAAI